MAKFTATIQFGSHVKQFDIEADKLSGGQHGVTLNNEDGSLVAYFPPANLMGIWNTEKAVNGPEVAGYESSKSSVMG
jgi:hypothetical protein